MKSYGLKPETQSTAFYGNRMKTVSNVMAGVGIAIVIGSFVLNATEPDAYCNDRYA